MNTELLQIKNAYEDPNTYETIYDIVFNISGENSIKNNTTIDYELKKLMKELQKHYKPIYKKCYARQYYEEKKDYTKYKCEDCGGSYCQSSITIHNKSKKHQQAKLKNNALLIE